MNKRRLGRNRCQRMLRNGMIKENTSRTQQLPRLLKVRLQHCLPHLLEHTHRNQLIVSTVILHLSIITDIDSAKLL